MELQIQPPTSSTKLPTATSATSKQSDSDKSSPTRDWTKHGKLTAGKNKTRLYKAARPLLWNFLSKHVIKLLNFHSSSNNTRSRCKAPSRMLQATPLESEQIIVKKQCKLYILYSVER